MSKSGIDQLLNRVIKLEEAVTKLAAWTHFSEPLDFGSVSMPTPLSASAQSGLSSTSKGKCSQIPSNSGSARPRRSCRKRSPPVATTTSKKKLKPKKHRSVYEEYDSDQESNSSSDYQVNNLHTVTGDSDAFQEAHIPSVNVKMEIEEEAFAVLPDSPQDQDDDESDNFECADGESANQGIPSKCDTLIASSSSQQDDDDTETPGLLIFPSASSSNSYVAYHGFLYTYDSPSKNKEKELFRCHQSSRKYCRGRLHLSPNLKKVVSSQEYDTRHNHPAEQDFVDAKYFKWRINHLAATKSKSVSQIIAEELPKVPEACKKYLPSLSSIQRNLQRHAQVNSESGRMATATKNLQNCADIPDDFCTQFKSSSGELFVRWDSAVHCSPSNKNDRFFICCTQSNLDFLAGCDLWLLDGGFKCSPPLFDQLLVIYGVKTWIFGGTGLPLVYCLLPNRNVEMYASIISTLQSLRALSAPSCILSDYNSIIRNALVTAFPNTNHGGNFFHFADAVWNHIRHDNPLHEQVNTSSDFQVHIWQFVSLAFVPLEDVQNSFHQLETSAFFQIHAGLFQHFLSYFKSTWLGAWNAERGQMVPPQFPIQHWNCYESLFQKNSPKMNVTSKSYHDVLLSYLTQQKPTLYKFMDCLLRYQVKTDAKLAIFNANKSDKSALKKKNLMQFESNLKKMVQGYPDKIDILSYLNAIACFLIKNHM